MFLEFSIASNKLSIDFLLRSEEDLEWKPVEEYYSDVYQNKDTYNDSLEQSSLLGFALGDAFGVPYEFLPKNKIRTLELDGMIGKDIYKENYEKIQSQIKR